MQMWTELQKKDTAETFFNELIAENKRLAEFLTNSNKKPDVDAFLSFLDNAAKLMIRYRDLLNIQDLPYKLEDISTNIDLFRKDYADNPGKITIFQTNFVNTMILVFNCTQEKLASRPESARETITSYLETMNRLLNDMRGKLCTDLSIPTDKLLSLSDEADTNHSSSSCKIV